MARPRPRLGDHVEVTLVLLLTLLGVVPFLAHAVVGPFVSPWLRRRARRRLERPTPPLSEPPPPDPRDWEGREVFVVAGEPSGDRLAARVVAAMKERCPGLAVRGFAGPRTARAGATLDRDILAHAVIGVVPVIRSLPTWWGLMTEFLVLLRTRPPDVLLTVDFPGLNGRLARWARRRGVCTVHLVPPSVWAYAPWRVRRWRRAADRLLAVFPFEPKVFEGSGVPCTYVGHPLFEAPLAPPRTPPAWPGEGAAWVELLPGSRRQEIRAHAALLLDAAARIEDAHPALGFRVRLAAEEHEAIFASAARAAPRRPARLEVVHGPPVADESEPLLGAIACSGTVTGELGAALVPMAIVYRVSYAARLGAWVGLTTPWIGLVNLIAGTTVAPERLQVGGDGARVARAFLEVAGTPDSWGRTRAILAERVRGPLETPNVADRAARAVFATYAPRSQAPVGDPATPSRPAGGPA